MPRATRPRIQQKYFRIQQNSFVSDKTPLASSIPCSTTKARHACVERRVARRADIRLRATSFGLENRATPVTNSCQDL